MRVPFAFRLTPERRYRHREQHGSYEHRAPRVVGGAIHQDQEPRARRGDQYEPECPERLGTDEQAAVVRGRHLEHLQVTERKRPSTRLEGVNAQRPQRVGNESETLG